MTTLLALVLAAQLPLADTLASSGFWPTFPDNALGDDDSDGLYNALETSLGLSPTNACTFPGTNDFFFVPAGASNCAGVLYTDHDWIEDFWEDAFPAASRHTADFRSSPLHDGWTVWDYCRANLWGASALDVATSRQDRPAPALRLTAAYADSQPVADAPLVIHAYSSADMVAPDAVFVVSNAADIAYAPIRRTIDAPVAGWLHGGRNAFVAFLDLDGSGNYSTGEPMGCALNVPVGWHSCSLDITLSDTSPVFTRLSLADDTTDREVVFGSDAIVNTNLVQGVGSGGRYERVRVIRTLINEYGIQDIGITNRVFVDKTLNLAQRPYLCELDVLAPDAPDIDWTFFQDEVMGNYYIDTGHIDPTAVTYRVVLGSGDISPNGTNNLFRVASVRAFDPSGARAVPTNLAVSTALANRPEFSWSLADNTFSAFRLQILQGAAVAYDSGICLLQPPVGGVYRFSPPAFLGDHLAANTTYSWRVSVYNAKFQTDLWSDGPAFSLPSRPDCPALAVSVACPDSTTGTLRLLAFDVPDFQSPPVASASLASFSSAASLSITLPPTCSAPYLLAFIDSNANSILDPQEHFGYLSNNSTGGPFIFNPVKAPPYPALSVLPL